MRDQGEIERLLAQTPVPSLREGPHQQQLKAELLQPTDPSHQTGDEPMRTTKRFRPTRLMKLAAGVFLAAVLVATGWAAEKVYQNVVKKYVNVELETIEYPAGHHSTKTLSGGIVLSADVLPGTSIPADAPPGTVEKAEKNHEEIKRLIAEKKYKLIKTVETPFGQKEHTYRFNFADGGHVAITFLIPLEDVASWEDYVKKSEKIGRVVISSPTFTGISTSIPADSPPGTAEKVKRHHEEMKQLIAQKKYKLIKTLEKRGRKSYVYQFTFADGERDTQTFSIPLEDVASWEDYWKMKHEELQKKQEQEEQRLKKIYRAIAAGKFRMLDSKASLTHICRDADSNQTLWVSRLVKPDGKDEALIYRELVEGTPHENPWEKWQDHLQAIRQGKRVLLDLRVVKKYIYEVTLDDGSTTTYDYGGGQPLEKLSAEERAKLPGTTVISAGSASTGGF